MDKTCSMLDREETCARYSYILRAISLAVSDIRASLFLFLSFFMSLFLQVFAFSVTKFPMYGRSDKIFASPIFRIQRKNFKSSFIFVQIRQAH